MRKSDLPTGKKRYSLSLTPDHVKRFHAVLVEIGADKGYMSRCVDEFIDETADVLEELLASGKEKGQKLGLKDIFWVLGKKMDDMVQDEKEFVQGKENLCPKCGLPLHKFHNCELNPTAEGRKNAKSSPKAKKVESRKG